MLAIALHSSSGTRLFLSGIEDSPVWVAAPSGFEIVVAIYTDTGYMYI